MTLLEFIKTKFCTEQIGFTPKFEIATWQNEQVALGKISGIDSSIYNYPDLNPVLMETARKTLELGAAPSAVSKVVNGYLNGEINEIQFEELCDNSIYIVDIDYLKEKFHVKKSPEEKIRNYDYPSAFYGACFGDIAGSSYEFECNVEKRKGLNFNTCIQAGSQPTDDTILSCATAKALEQKVLLHNRQLEWSDYNKDSTYPFIENPFAKLYKEYAHMPFTGASYGGAFYSWVQADELTPYGSFGNGSAMRVSPIPEIFGTQDQVTLYAAASAAATHNHYEGVKGAVITAMAIWMAKNGYSKQQIFKYMTGFYEYEHTKLYVFRGVGLRDFTMDELKYSIGPAVCPYSIPAAAVCFYYADSFEDVINNVLSFDGDTDTIGAISGSIAGAYYGVPGYARDVVNERKPEKIFDEAVTIFHHQY